MSNYSNFMAPTILSKKAKYFLKQITITSFLICCFLYITSVTMFPHDQGIHDGLLLGTIVINIGSTLSILSYTKREIIYLTDPGKGTKGLTAIWSNALDLILVPGLTVLVTIKMFEYYGETSLLSIGPIIYLIISITNLAPLKHRKQTFTRLAHLSISEQLNNITVARLMAEGIDKRTKTYKKYHSWQIKAEEIMRRNTEFLQTATGKRAFLASIIRTLLPIATTIIPILLRMLL